MNWKIFILLFLLVFFWACHKKKTDSIPINSVSSVNPISTTTLLAEPTNTIEIIQTPTVGLEIGDIAPELNLKDSNETFVKLSSLRKKLVLIDFWASWCKPCKIENKKLINIYNTYKDTLFKTSKGFEIYMVSVESKRELWIKSLINEKYNWPYNLFDEGGGATWAYNVTSIPKNFLIDTNGIIIAKNLRDTVVEKTLIHLLKPM